MRTNVVDESSVFNDCSMGRHAIAVGVLLLALFTSGCGWCRARQCDSQPASAATAPLNCVATSRRPIEVDLASIPAPTQPLMEAAYCNLTECEAGCLAAKNSSAAKLFEQEAEAVASQQQHHGTTSELAENVLRLQAVHERNRAAAAARVLLLRLAEAEAGVDNLVRRELVVRELDERVLRLQGEGVDSPLTLAEVDANRFEIVAKQHELQGTIEGLNQQLLKVLNVQLCDKRIWPDVELKMDACKIDRCEAFELATLQRADLASVRLLAESDDSAAVAVIRAVLSRLNAGLGSSSTASPIRQFLDPAGASVEASVRQGQVRETTAQQEKVIWHDVVEAVTKLESLTASASATAERLAALEATAERLEKKRAEDPAVAFEQSKHRLIILGVEQDLLHTVIEWKVEVVKLEEVMGSLAIDCGYSPQINVSRSHHRHK